MSLSTLLCRHGCRRIHRPRHLTPFSHRGITRWELKPGCCAFTWQQKQQQNAGNNLWLWVKQDFTLQSSCSWNCFRAFGSGRHYVRALCQIMKDYDMGSKHFWDLPDSWISFFKDFFFSITTPCFPTLFFTWEQKKNKTIVFVIVYLVRSKPKKNKT